MSEHIDAFHRDGLSNIETREMVVGNANEFIGFCNVGWDDTF